MTHSPPLFPATLARRGNSDRAGQTLPADGKGGGEAGQGSVAGIYLSNVRGLARLGAARQGLAGQGLARQGEARQPLTKGRKMKVESDFTSKKIVNRTVRLVGMTDIMFDRYAGDNKTKLEPWQKLYFAPGSKNIALPSLNLMSFLSAQNTNSAPKRLLPAKEYRKTANGFLSFVSIAQMYIPFLRDGQPIEFGEFEDDKDKKSGVYVHRSVARLKDGIPNPKERPVLPTPWALEFGLSIYPNKEFQEQQLINIFEGGGVALGLGTFRGVFGKFSIERWD